MKRITDPPADGCSAKRQKTLCSICKCPNHKEANCFFRKGAPHCNYCSKPGHVENDCWSKNGRKKKKGKGRTRQKGDSANVATTSRGLNIQEVHVTYNSSRNNSEAPSVYYWHADSAATCYVTNDFATLSDYVPKIETIHGLGNIEVQSGCGTVKLKSKIGDRSYTIILGGVYYVPLQTNSLLSIHCLDQQGSSAYIGNSRILIYDQHKNTVTTGHVKQNQYQLDVQTIYPESVQVTQEKLSWDQ